MDPSRADDVMSLLSQISRESQKSLLASMHSVELVKKYFDRAIAIKEANIYFDKKVADISDEELNSLYSL